MCIVLKITLISSALVDPADLKTFSHLKQILQAGPIFMVHQHVSRV